MEVCPYSYFRLCGYIWGGPWVSFVTADGFSVKVTKTTSRIGVSLTHSLPFCFLPIFNSLKWPYEIDVNQANLFSWNWWSGWTLVNFPTWIPDCDCHNPALLDFFLSCYASLCSTMAPPHRVILIMLSQFPLTFGQTQNGIPRFIALLMNIVVLIETVFVIIWEIRERSLNSKKKTQLMEERLVKLWITLRNISTTYKFIGFVTIKSCWVSTGSESRI